MEGNRVGWTFFSYESLVSEESINSATLSGKIFRVTHDKGDFDEYLEFVEGDPLIIQTIIQEGDTSSIVMPYKAYEIDGVNLIHIDNFLDYRFFLVRKDEQQFKVLFSHLLNNKHQVWTEVDLGSNHYSSMLLGTWYRNRQPITKGDLDFENIDEFRFCPEKFDYRRNGRVVESGPWYVSHFGKIIATTSTFAKFWNRVSIKPDLLLFSTLDLQSNRFRKAGEHLEGNCIDNLRRRDE